MTRLVEAAEAGRAPVPSVRVGVDTGGTFTDLVLQDDATGERRLAKVSSTPRRPAQAVFDALERTGVAAEAIGAFTLGTTIATNALLERKGQRVVYVTTAGFEDTPFIQRINRKSLFDLQWVKARPYVARRDCVGVRERVAADGGVRVALERAEVERVVAELRARATEEPGGVAIAVNLLFSYLDPAHERELAAAIREALPDVPLSVAHELAPIWREYERGNTAIVDAYLRRLVGRFAGELEEGLVARGVRGARALLKSNGGRVPLATAPRRPVDLVLSGLAGGMIAGREIADAVGAPRVITLDMGGTSADVGVVVDGVVRSADQVEFEWGLPVAVPVVDLSTIGAGGSSIARFDQGGLLEVGPQSAGADPGPAAYGKGGADATVTDANLVLGRLDPGYFLGGELPLDAGAARRALEPVAERLGVPLEEAAQAVVEVATENMANAIRLLAANRGLDYRRFRLAAFGGAGPLHAAALASRVGLAGVIVPPAPGLASAAGALDADLRVDRRLTRPLRSDLASDADLRETLARLAAEATAELEAEGGGAQATLALTVSGRYLGQNFEREVTLPPDAEGDLVAVAVARFHEAHELAYGYRIEDAVVEFVHVNAVAIERRPAPPRAPLPERGPAEPATARPVYFKEGGWLETPIYRRDTLGAGAELRGPAVVEEPDSTTLVLPGQHCRVDASGSLLLAALVPAEVTVG